MITQIPCFKTDDGQLFHTKEDASVHELSTKFGMSKDVSKAIINNKDKLAEYLGVNPSIQNAPPSVKVLTSKLTIKDFDKMVANSMARCSTLETAKKFVIRYLAGETIEKWEIMEVDGGDDGSVSGIFRQFVKANGDRVHKLKRKVDSDGLVSKKSNSYYRLPMFNEVASTQFRKSRTVMAVTVSPGEVEQLIREKIINVLSVVRPVCNHRSLVYLTMDKMTPNEPQHTVAAVKKCIAEMVSEKKIQSIQCEKEWKYTLPSVHTHSSGQLSLF